MDGGCTTEMEFTAGFLFAGIGAGARGFLDAKVNLNGRVGCFRSVGGVDLDESACRDFERLTGSPSLTADLKTMTAEQLRGFMGEKAPDVIFMSPPCKGFSGLMSPKKARARKYREMNLLALWGTELVLKAWGANGPGLILLENVPRIATRGSALLRRIRRRLQKHGYVVHGGAHNCGKIGRLAQSRDRYLLVARHATKVPVFLYQPEQHPLRPCGEVLGALPLPNDPRAGRLHRLPDISLRTWLRLACIRPGKDWRDLASLTELPSGPQWTRHRVAAWSSATGAVAGEGSNGAGWVADPRLGEDLVDGGFRFTNQLALVSWEAAARCVTGASRPGAGALSVADPRVQWHRGTLGVVPWASAVGTVTGNARPATGNFSVGDVRVRAPSYPHTYGVLSTTSPAFTITGNMVPGGGAFSVADLRLSADCFEAGFGVTPWWSHFGTVTAKAGSPTTGRYALADVRLGPAEGATWFKGKFEVMAGASPSRTVIGGPSNGADAFADLRITCEPWTNSGVLGVLDWLRPTGTVVASLDLWSGWASIADPRSVEPSVEAFEGVVDGGWRGAAGARGRSRGESRAPEGFWCASDPRVPGNPRLIVRWLQRDLDDPPLYVPVFPGRGDGSWHRPLTTLELCALQGLPMEVDGAALDLDGPITLVREHVGNAVPVGAAKYVGCELLRTLVVAASGAFSLSHGNVWVRPGRDGVFPLYGVTREATRTAKHRKKGRRLTGKQSGPMWAPTTMEVQ